MRSHRRTYSATPIPTVRFQASPSRSNREALHELRAKADELERLFAARKLRSPGHRLSSARGSRLGDARSEHRAAEVVDEVPTESFGEPTTSGLVEFDGDLLLDMVHNLQYNMKQSLSGPLKGRLYERYMQRRDAKLRQEWGSPKWARKKEAMKGIEDSLKKFLAEMKVRSGDVDYGKDSGLQGRRYLTKQRSFSAGATIDFRKQHDVEDLCEQVKYDQHKSLGTILIDDSAKNYYSRKLLSSKSASSSKNQNSTELTSRLSLISTNSSFIKQRTQPEYQSIGESSDPRKENMKPPTRVRQVTTHLDSRTFDRSKSSAAGIDALREEKQPRFRHMRNSSVCFGELKEFVPLNSDSSSLALSNFRKDQNENSVSKKIQVSGEPKSFLRRGGGIGPGVGASIAKLRASKAPESNCKGENEEELVNQQECFSDMVGSMDDELARACNKHRAFGFSAEADSEEEQSSRELGSSDDNEYKTQYDGSSAFASSFNESFCNVDELLGEEPGSWYSNIHPSFSPVHKVSDIDGSVNSPRGNPSTGHTHRLNLMREAHAGRVRKKWGTVEKPKFASNDSDQSLKDVAKAFKKLLKFGNKSKNTERRLNDSLSTSAASEGGGTEDGSDPGKRSIHALTKSRKVYLNSTNAALSQDRIFPQPARRSFMFFPSFNSRRTEVEA